MEPELAAAFDLIELRTPNARTVTDLIAALTTVHGDVEGMQGEISSVHERLTALEETDSSLAHLLGEILVELRVLQRRTGEHFPRTERRLDALTERVDALTTLVDALTVIARGNRESIDRLERIVAQHGRALVALRGEVAELRGEVAELRGEVAELRGEVAELRGIAERSRNCGNRSARSWRGCGRSATAANRPTTDRGRRSAWSSTASGPPARCSASSRRSSGAPVAAASRRPGRARRRCRGAGPPSARSGRLSRRTRS